MKGFVQSLICGNTEVLWDSLRYSNATEVMDIGS